MDIISKYTVGSDEGISDLLTIINSSTLTLHKGMVAKSDIINYVNHDIDPRKIINKLNDLSNQLIITYADNRPAGFSIVKSGSVSPAISDGRRQTQIVFVILPEFDSPECRDSLWKKCRSTLSFTDIVWINIMVHDPLVEFFKKLDFKTITRSKAEPFHLPSYIMAREISKGT